MMLTEINSWIVLKAKIQHLAQKTLKASILEPTMPIV